MHVTEKYCGHHCSVIIYTKMLEDVLGFYNEVNMTLKVKVNKE